MSKSTGEAKKKPTPPNPLPIEWPRLPVVIVSGGPSLTLGQVRQIGMARARNKCRVIAINDAMYPCWFADIGYACDAKWWKAHEGVTGFRGLKVICGTETQNDLPFPDLHPITLTGLIGYDPTPGTVRGGGNSGHQALHIAGSLSDLIYLVAYDYTDDPECKRRIEEDHLRDHWFGKHPAPLDITSDCQAALNRLRILSTELERRGVRIRNASLKSKISWLPRCSLDELN